MPGGYRDARRQASRRRLLADDLSGFAVPAGVKKTGGYVKRGDVYKQLNAPFGTFGMDLLTASTKALASDDSDDATYTSIEGQISNLTGERDTLASQIKSTLDAVAFDGQSLTEQQIKPLLTQAQDLLDQAHTLATS
jgi:hypothetical protein